MDYWFKGVEKLKVTKITGPVGNAVDVQGEAGEALGSDGRHCVPALPSCFSAQSIQCFPALFALNV